LYYTFVTLSITILIIKSLIDYFFLLNEPDIVGTGFFGTGSNIDGYNLPDKMTWKLIKDKNLGYNGYIEEIIFLFFTLFLYIKI